MHNYMDMHNPKNEMFSNTIKKIFLNVNGKVVAQRAKASSALRYLHSLFLGKLSI